jgi:DNA-binding transcriptional regulator GbsR (MarR family)
MDEDISSQIEDLKTDENELNQVLNQYDLDEDLEAEFDAIDEEFRQLEIIYQSLLNTRKFLNNAT